MSSHKTKQTLDLFERLRMPYIFYAPASYKAVPMKSVLMNLKLTDFRQRHFSLSFKSKEMMHNKLSKKQLLISQVADLHDQHQRFKIEMRLIQLPQEPALLPRYKATGS